MNQANQKALIQTANMDLINIRFIELSYFSVFFSSFGTQCAVLNGLITGSLSQVPGQQNPTGCWYGWIVLYWISSAITLGASMHAIVCCLYLEVFGQGLGLRGPLGSMVRAVEGLVIEQQEILNTFLIAIFSFGFQCIGMYWIMMDWKSAIATTVITIVGIICWYRYALRLYNRFSWKAIKVEWRGEDQDESENEDELDHDSSNPVKSAMHNSSKRKRQSKAKSASTRSEEETQALEDLSAEMGKKETPGGYLTLRSPTMFGMDPWQRRYFVVRGRLIYYYKDKRSFQLDPVKPLNTRAIDLEGYTLIAGAREPPYSIALVPVDENDNRKAWKFRCDTLAEFQKWIEILSLSLKLCDSGSDLVNIAPSNPEEKEESVEEEG